MVVLGILSEPNKTKSSRVIKNQTQKKNKVMKNCVKIMLVLLKLLDATDWRYFIGMYQGPVSVPAGGRRPPYH